jgi:hypothetical protein
MLAAIVLCVALFMFIVLDTLLAGVRCDGLNIPQAIAALELIAELQARVKELERPA